MVEWSRQPAQRLAHLPEIHRVRCGDAWRCATIALCRNSRARACHTAPADAAIGIMKRGNSTDGTKLEERAAGLIVQLADLPSPVRLASQHDAGDCGFAIAPPNTDIGRSVLIPEGDAAQIELRIAI